MTFRPGLLWEILRLSVDTLRANKLRSALTILGVVIGVMSIVAMTSLIGGFADQIRTQINQLGANTVYVEKAGFESFSSGRDFMELLKRPNLNEGDAAALAASPLVGRIDVQAGDFGGPWSEQVRVTYAGQATKRLPLVGTSASFPDTNSIRSRRAATSWTSRSATARRWPCWGSRSPRRSSRPWTRSARSCGWTARPTR